jgi:glycosyltransferase involved in cell wall biosynthesis
MSRKKLLIVSLHPRGGCHQYSSEIISRFTDEKEVYLSASTDEKHNILEYNTIKDRGTRLEKYSSLIFFLIKLFIRGKFFKRYKALLLMGYTPWDSFIAKVFKWTGNPVFYVVHDGKMHLGSDGIVSRKRILSTMKDSRCLIFLSDYVRKLVEDSYDIRKTFHIAPHGLIDYGNIPTEPKKKRDKPILLLIGRLSEYKGIDILLEAIKTIPDVFEKVIIAGKSVDEFQINTDNPKVEVIDRWLTIEEMVDLLDRCDILLFPYIEATQSGVATLAINYLAPSIVTDVGGFKEQFHENGALFIQPSSPEQLRDAIVELSTNKALYNRISQALLQLRDSYSWDSIASSLQNFINENTYLKKSEKKHLKSVLFVIPNLQGGGAEKLLIDIIKRIDRKKYTPSICLLEKTGVYLKAIPKDIDYFSIIHNRPFRFVFNKFLLKSNRLLKLYLKVAIRKKYDVEIAFLEGPTTKVVANHSCNAVKIAWVHIDLLEKHWTKPFFKDQQEEINCYRKMDKIVFVSEEARSKFNTLFKTPFKEQIVLKNLIDSNEIIQKSNEFSVEKTKFTLCAAGRLNYQKGYDRLLQVCHRLKKKGYNFECWILGEGEEKKKLKKQVSELGLNDVVLFKGFIENPYPYIKSADIYVNTSRAEGFSLVVAEAICLSKAIVATRVTGSTEMLDEGRFGLLTEQTEDAIFEGIESFILSEDKRKMYEERAIERSKMFNVSDSLNAFYKLFE